MLYFMKKQVVLRYCTMDLEAQNTKTKVYLNDGQHLKIIVLLEQSRPHSCKVLLHNTNLMKKSFKT